jgi:ABC-2 type transport system permease protein
MIPIVLGFIVITLGVGMLLSVLYVRFRDIQPIWDVTSQILFYSSPIMYVASSYKRFEHVAMLNPFALMLTQMGHAFIHSGVVTTRVPAAAALVHGRAVLVRAYLTSTTPMRSAYVAAGGLAHVLISVALIPLVLALGVWFFAREAPRIAEIL